jgi:predicted MFS family arabinose efflux permease
MDSLNRPFRRDRSVALAYLFNSALTGFQVAIGATMPVIRSDLNISLTVASLHFTVMAVCGMLSSSTVARVAARLGRRATCIASVAVISIGLLALCLAPSVALTLPAAAVIGLAGPFAIILSQTEVLDRHPAHQAMAMAELNLVVSVALMATTLGVGPLVALTDSWRIALLIPTVAAISAMLPLHGLEFSDASRPKSRGPNRRMTELAWLFCLLIICQAGFEWSYGYQAAEFLNRAGGVSKGTAATLMTVFYAGMVISRIGLIRVVRRFAASHLLTASFALALVGFLLLAGGPTTGIKVAGLMVSGFGIAVTFPMIITLAAAAFPEATDWIVAKLYLAGGVAIAIAPFAIGALGDEIGIARSFWVLGIMAAMGLIASPLLRRAQIDGRALSVAQAK